MYLSEPCQKSLDLGEHKISEPPLFAGSCFSSPFSWRHVVKPWWKWQMLYGIPLTRIMGWEWDGIPYEWQSGDSTDELSSDSNWLVDPNLTIMVPAEFHFHCFFLPTIKMHDLRGAHIIYYTDLLQGFCFLPPLPSCKCPRVKALLVLIPVDLVHAHPTDPVHSAFNLSHWGLV